MNLLFEHYLIDLTKKNYKSEIYQAFLNDMDEKYLKETSNKRKVIDFIAGMTDAFLLREIEKIRKGSK